MEEEPASPLQDRIAEAAKLLGLDPEDVQHRKLLLEAVQKAPKKKRGPGRPKGSVKWSESRLESLGALARVYEIESGLSGQSSISDLQLAKRICESRPGPDTAKRRAIDYLRAVIFRHENALAFQSVEVVRRHLPAARKAYEWFLYQTADTDAEPPEDLDGEDCGDDRRDELDD